MLLVRINIVKGLIATFNVLLHSCIINFVRLLRLANYLSIMAASLKFVTDTIKINVAYMSAKISQE